MRRAALLLPLGPFLATCAYPMDTEPVAHSWDPRGCPSRGGHIEQRGMFGGRVCVVPYADAGRACTDSSQCAGRCLLHYIDGVTIQSHPVGREAAGQCEADSPTYGCYGEILNGRITQPVCDD